MRKERLPIRFLSPIKRINSTQVTAFLFFGILATLAAGYAPPFRPDMNEVSYLTNP
jgi:hypothetical protein